jgi:glycosyltransferase involved in cell wall biosynthesis
MKGAEEGLRILIVSPFNPFPPYWGGASRIFNLVKHISRWSEITFLYNDKSQLKDTSDGHLFMDELKDLGVRVIRVPAPGRASQILNPLLMWRCLGLIRKTRPHFILSEFVWSAGPLLLMARLTDTMFGIDEHNVEYLRFERMKRGSSLSRAILRWYEGWTTRSSQIVFCVSDTDRDFLIEGLGLDGTEIMVLRNGVDSSRPSGTRSRREVRQSISIDEDATMFLFHGKLDYGPNSEALEIIRKELIPRLSSNRPSARIVVAGDNPPDWVNEAGTVRAIGVYRDLPELISAADCIISPLVSGGGTRIKIIESLFHRRMVISTSIGAESLEIENFDGWIRIADDWDSFYARMEEVVDGDRPPGPIDQTSLSAYDWQSIAFAAKERISDMVLAKSSR